MTDTRIVLYTNKEENKQDCPICFSILNLILSICNHAICRECWINCGERDASCPLCRHDLTDWMTNTMNINIYSKPKYDLRPFPFESFESFSNDIPNDYNSFYTPYRGAYVAMPTDESIDLPSGPFIQRFGDIIGTPPMTIRYYLPGVTTPSWGLSSPSWGLLNPHVLPTSPSGRHWSSPTYFMRLFEIFNIWSREHLETIESSRSVLPIRRRRDINYDSPTILTYTEPLPSYRDNDTYRHFAMYSPVRSVSIYKCPSCGNYHCQNSKLIIYRDNSMSIGRDISSPGLALINYYIDFYRQQFNGNSNNALSVSRNRVARYKRNNKKETIKSNTSNKPKTTYYNKRKNNNKNYTKRGR